MAKIKIEVNDTVYCLSKREINLLRKGHASRSDGRSLADRELMSVNPTHNAFSPRYYLINEKGNAVLEAYNPAPATELNDVDYDVVSRFARGYVLNGYGNWTDTSRVRSAWNDGCVRQNTIRRMIDSGLLAHLGDNESFGGYTVTALAKDLYFKRDGVTFDSALFAWKQKDNQDYAELRSSVMAHEVTVRPWGKDTLDIGVRVGLKQAMGTTLLRVQVKGIEGGMHVVEELEKCAATLRDKLNLLENVNLTKGDEEGDDDEAVD